MRGEMESINFADSLNQCLVLLEWSTEDLEREMRYKYSLDHLMRVREGKPFAEVERDIVETVTRACAEKVKTAVTDARLSLGAAEVAYQEFIRVVKQIGLRLADIANLAEETRVLVAGPLARRTQTVDLADNASWNLILQSIARSLTQQNMFDGDAGLKVQGNVLVASPVEPIRLSKDPFPKTYDYLQSPDTCDRCHQQIDSSDTYRCSICGLSLNTPD